MAAAQTKILIIDDDATVTETFARMLRLEGHQVRTAPSAELGLREADHERPDAIILDLRMPLVNGIGFLYRLREKSEHSATPVAIVTGDYFLDDAVLKEISDLGAQLHFKPLWLEELVAVAHGLIEKDCRAEKRQLQAH
jgi:DNA-binding response OmpR family regulator